MFILDTLTFDEIEYNSGCILYMQQFWAIVVKRFYYVKRNSKSLFAQILLPALFVCIAMTVALTAPQVHDLPPMILSPAQYYNGTRKGGNFVPFVTINGDELFQDANNMELIKTFGQAGGLSATCVLKQPDFNSSIDEFIKKTIEKYGRDYNKIRGYYNDECESVFYTGNENNEGKKPFQPPVFSHQTSADNSFKDDDIG